jgi:hypothetical protein
VSKLDVLLRPLKAARNPQYVCPIIKEFTLGDKKDNLGLIESLGEVEVVVPPTRNPFCSRRPVRCSDKLGNYNKHALVVYTNDYIAVVKPKFRVNC